MARFGFVLPALCACACAALAACAVGGAAGGPLSFEAAGDRVAFVGSPLRIPLRARSEHGAPIRFRLTASDVPDLCRDGRCRAGVRTIDAGRGELVWVPEPRDVGTWRFRLVASDGLATAEQEIEIEVRSSVGYDGRPRFVQPLGEGTTLDLTDGACFELDVVVHDPDARAVEIGQREPHLPGSELTAHDAFTATWRWCPDPSQLRESHQRLTLTADDGEGPTVEKSYLLVIRRPPKPGCEAVAPEIEPLPAVTEAGGVRLRARVRHPAGLRHPPLLHHAATDPGDKPDLTRMTQLTMELAEGTRADGTWEATVRPTTASAADTPVTVYYVLTATGSDGGDGSCERHTQAPSTGALAARTGSREAASAAPCEPCGADRECGASDRCVRIGPESRSYCLPACDTASCPTGYRCSSSAVESVEGASGRLCVPETERCDTASSATCDDDRFEDNDTLADAVPLAPGELSDGVSCHEERDDEDWFEVTVTERSQVLATLRGGTASDLDLAVVAADGSTVAAGDSTRSSEDLALCLDPGRYFLQVRSYGRGRNPYRLGWSTRAARCDAGCSPDAAEEDDDVTTARTTHPGADETFADNTICSGDDDWYAVSLSRGDTLHVELAFIQTSAAEDLDLHFMSPDLVDLTPCTESDPSTCSAFQGQSVDSNESYEHLVEEGGVYYVVVHGFAGAENTYDLRLWVER